ncbi:MAG TPA: OmpA family protein [Candidatus Angelobacter sp.]|nr:OmpA family protein [Candidatus Angelobacter sp.]
MKNKPLAVLAFCLAMVLPLSAQTSSDNPPQNPNDTTSAPSSMGTSVPQTTTQTPEEQNNPEVPGQEPQYHYQVNVVQRSTLAVDYRDRGGTTQVDFKGTQLMPKVEGRAKVTGHTGRLALDTSFHHLRPAREFGPEYLTYVLWAITPEGRPVNLGEVIPHDDGDVYVQLTTGLQEFGMILTAEPYFAVTRPSDLVVAENIVRSDTKGATHPITARYELLQKGQYTTNITPASLPASEAEHQKKTQLELLEAENAVVIAQASGADKYAPEAMQKAKDYLSQAQEYQRHDKGKTAIGTVARAAAESAEDARLITMEKKRQEMLTALRLREQERIRQARSEAERETLRAELARSEALREADQRSLAEQERLSAERARAQAEQARVEAEQTAQQAAREKAQAEQQLQQSQQQQQALAQQAEQARLQAQQAEQGRLQSEQQAEQQRQRLLQQLNQVLQTKDTAKGLIVNVSDVLFDTGYATLKPEAKVRLAKVAGLILAYPDLRLEVNGYTDSTGSHEFNQRLSERRADSVRDFLISQGVSSGNVGARGFAESDPIASNSTATGRQLNRRVELVVSGSAIGQNIGTTPYSTPTPITGAGGVAGAAGAAGTAVTPPNSSPTPNAVGNPTGTVSSPTLSTTTTPSGTTTPTSTPPPSTTGAPPANSGQQPPPK